MNKYTYILFCEFIYSILDIFLLFIIVLWFLNGVQNGYNTLFILLGGSHICRGENRNILYLLMQRMLGE